MNPKEQTVEFILNAIGLMLYRAGVLPEDGSPEYYGFGPASDQPGDCRDCSDKYELAKFYEIFGEKPPRDTTD